ncbi:MAG: ribbon-helix-helix domain-containing protein [Rhodospirillales bacterium]|nr:ribbon-helix-helix domain-containing protein [Rhodospirillales bacterium]
MTDDPSRVRKRSIRIAGHATSVSLEQAFWNRLRLISAARGVSINGLIAEIDRHRTGNLSSAIRLFVLEESDRAGSDGD